MFALRPPVLAALVLILAGCSHRREPLAIQPSPAPVVALIPPAPPPVSAINRGLSPAAAAWHLRVALNVAALACRGGSELQIVAGYNALLRTRKAELAAVQAALAAEYKRRGGDWQDAYDDAMTRLYNFFSQAQARDAFCAAAGDVLAEADAVAAPNFATFAGAKLPLVDAPFARIAEPRAPRVPVIAAVVAAPAPTAAQLPPPPTPRLAVNVAALGE